MFQRDYILRMIEMMGDLARRVAELMEQLEYLHQLDDASRLHCGLPLNALESLSADSLKDMLGPESRLYASELLYLRAVEGRAVWEERQDFLLKSLRLLASLEEESILCEIRAPRMKELKAECLPMLTGEDFLACARFYEEAELYDEMEDALFQAVEGTAEASERALRVRLGCGMLEKASRAGEKALTLCGMTAQELMDAAQDLRRMGVEGK
ncbi:MAG: hypothetical protein E7319_07250 [Clostridiales bacterium]|nr:hypothetical protein [Clostridiales bacterium]